MVIIDNCAHCGDSGTTAGRGLCESCYAEYLEDAGRIGACFTMQDLLERFHSEVSYRQLDHWMRCGRFGDIDGAEGSGSRRLFTAAEAALIEQLVNETLSLTERLRRISTGQRWAEMTAATAVA